MAMATVSSAGHSGALRSPSKASRGGDGGDSASTIRRLQQELMTLMVCLSTCVCQCQDPQPRASLQYALQCVVVCVFAHTWVIVIVLNSLFSLLRGPLVDANGNPVRLCCTCLCVCAHTHSHGCVSVAMIMLDTLICRCFRDK